MKKTIYLLISLLFGIQVFAADSHKSISESVTGKIRFHMKNHDIGYPEDGSDNNFTRKQTAYISEAGKNYFVFPSFQSNTDDHKRYILNDITGMVAITFLDASVSAKTFKFPAIGKSATIDFPLPSGNPAESIICTIQGKGFYENTADFLVEGKPLSGTDIHYEVLGAAWNSANTMHIWNHDGHLYVHARYPSAMDTTSTFKTAFGNKF